MQLPALSGKAMKKIIIIGCGGHARSAADVVIDNDPEAEIIFYDNNARKNEKIFGRYFILPLKKINLCGQNFFIAIGDNSERKKLFGKLCKMNGINIAIISRRSYVSSSAVIEPGAFIGESSHVGPCVRIGTNTIINTGAIIEHEAEIGSFSHVSVNAAICGRCKIGSNVFVGASAVIKDKISVCDGVTIGAGAVVVKNIKEPGIYVGVPASRIFAIKDVDMNK